MLFEVVPCKEAILEKPCFHVKGVILHSFLFSKPDSLKVLNCIIDILSVKYFCGVVHAQAASSSRKKQVFLKLTIFFYVNKKIIFSESASKIKVMLHWTLFFILLTSAVI